MTLVLQAVRFAPLVLRRNPGIGVAAVASAFARALGTE
jgi:hypothetical protein